jgi:hypothetical protein
MHQGCVLALTGKASDAVQMIASGITAWRSTGSTMWMPLYLSYLARAYPELDQFDDAWRCIGEAMTAVETTNERWCVAEIHRMAGEIALMSPEPDAATRPAIFSRQSMAGSPKASTRLISRRPRPCSVSCTPDDQFRNRPDFVAAHGSGPVQVFGRRQRRSNHALIRPASEKRQGTKSRRWVVRRRCRGLWGFGRALKRAGDETRQGRDRFCLAG